MLCQNCNKNEAQVRYTQIINGEKTEMLLCEQCSKKLGIDYMDFNMPINFSSFFGDLIDNYNQSYIGMGDNSQILKCDVCNMTYGEFIQTGKFGCSNCYDVFENKIDLLFTRIHGNNQYLGRKSKVSNNKMEGVKKDDHVYLRENENVKNNGINSSKSKTEKQTKMEKLQEDLKLAIKEERYEEAAKIRDEIKKMDK